jgi:hypothetical protein
VLRGAIAAADAEAGGRVAAYYRKADDKTHTLARGWWRGASTGEREVFALKLARDGRVAELATLARANPSFLTRTVLIRVYKALHAAGAPVAALLAEIDESDYRGIAIAALKKGDAATVATMLERMSGRERNAFLFVVDSTPDLRERSRGMVAVFKEYAK